MPSRRALEKNLPDYLKERFAHLGLDRPGSVLLIACSGGADSIALLRLSIEAARRSAIQVHVGHVQHGLRGAASERDAQFVQDLCGKLSVPCDVARVNVEAFARSHRLSLEAAARVCRYRALTDLARKPGAQAILTAHTLDDQAETVLINLLRGCGTLGLSGIWEKSLFPGARIPVLRPLLGVHRSALRTYLKSIRQGHREDATNRSPAHLRNWVRHKALPILRQRSPLLEEHLARLSSILQSEEKWWKGLKSRVDLEGFLRYPIAVQRRVLRDAMPLEPSFDAIESLRTQPTRFQSPPPNFLDRLRGPFSRPLKVPGINRSLPHGWRLTARVIQGKPRLLDQSPWTVSVDWSNVKNQRFVWRSWQAGDRFQPLGMRGAKKLSDFFCDEKVPGSVKGEIPLVEANGRLVWLVGLRLADSVKVTSRTKQTLILSASKEQ